MLILLTIDDREKSIFRKKSLCRLPVNRMRIQDKPFKESVVRHIKYINRNGRVNLRKIARKAGEDRFHILYKGRESVNGKSLRAFEPTDFRGRLCVNMGLASLESMKTLPASFRVGLYDALGEETDVAERIVSLTDNFTVVTKNVPIYEALSQKLMWEKGVSLRISRRVSSLSECDLIIAPSKLRDKFSAKAQSVVLTCETPSFPLMCRVFYTYDIKLPKELGDLCPEDFDHELFGAGLCSLCKVSALGSTVPLLCRNGEDAQTYLSLGRYFIDTFST